MRDDGIDVSEFMRSNSNNNSGYRRGESTPLVQYNGSQGRSNESRRSSSSRRPHVDRMEEDLRRCRRQSVDNGPINTVVEVVGIAAKVFDNLRHSFVAGVVAATLIVTPLAVSLSNNFNDSVYQDNAIVQMVNETISDATHRTNSGEDSFFYDDFTIAGILQDEIENGASPYIVLGALASDMTADYEQDDLDNIVNRIFKVDCGADGLVRMIDPERYADGIHGDNFMNDYKTLAREDYRTQGLTESDDLLRRFYYQNNDLTPDSNQELSEMMQDGEQQDSVSNEKGLGGK